MKTGRLHTLHRGEVEVGMRHDNIILLIVSYQCNHFS